MKITNVGPTNTGGVRKKDEKRAADGFASLLASDEAEATESSGISSLQPLSMMGALLTAQMVEDDPKERQLRHGKELLDHLDSLRLDLLSGGVSPATAQRLLHEVRAEVGVVMDPRLAEILADIETRAAVELAKVEMSAKNRLQE